MPDPVTRLADLMPEITLGLAACASLFFGLWPGAAMRRSAAWIPAVALVLAGGMVMQTLLSPTSVPVLDIWQALTLPAFVKLAVVGVGLLLWLVMAQLPDFLPQIRATDDAPPGRRVDMALVFRGEIFAFFLLSLMGVMLVAGARDLVWLFLALELTSLPTYVLVAVSRDRPAAQEAAVKYFFLGALAAAVFLYGFALIYGATGATDFELIRSFVHAHAAAGKPLPPLLLTGLVLAVVGIGFKIAAVPMHFYVADVYQGAASPVAAFLAFVPKTAGFAALILLLQLAASPAGELPRVLTQLLAVLAALTMTVGNVLGLLQSSIKRTLGYSSIAHSGYMLVGLLAWSGPEPATGGAIGNGVAAVLFYLVAYGLANLAAFAVLGCLQSGDDEADSFDDLAGLSRRQPVLAVVMLLAMLSLIGLPPMVGFLGKIYLFGSALQHGYLWLVLVAVLNSAVSATYYLRIAATCYFGQDQGRLQPLPTPTRRAGAMLAAAAALVLGLAGNFLVDAARLAADHQDGRRGPREPAPVRPRVHVLTLEKP